MTEEEPKNVEQPPAEEVEEKPPKEEEPVKKKRTYQKRKMQILQQEDEKKQQNETRDEEGVPPPKKVRVTKQEDIPPPAERPSFLRGAVVKPLLLGLLASGSFLVNHMFNTHVPASLPQQQKKNTTQKTTENLRNENVMLPIHKKTVRIPGFD